MSDTKIDNKIAYKDIATTKEGERELKEDELRDTECAFCRFVPCNVPNQKTLGVPFYCSHPACPHNRANKYIHSFYFHETIGEIGKDSLIYKIDLFVP